MCFGDNFPIIQELFLTLFAKQKSEEVLDNLESLHIGISSDSEVNENGLRKIIEQQKNLHSLSLYFKNLKNDKILIEINDVMNESLFVYLENLTIGMHFQDDL